MTRQRREHRRRRGQGEPRRRSRHQVAGVRADRLGPGRARPAGRGRALRADLGQRRARARPAGLDAQGSEDGQTWTTLDTQTGQTFAERFQTKEYDFANSDGVPALPPGHHAQQRRRHRPARRAAALERAGRARRPPPDMRSIVGSGPRGGYNAKAGVGFTGVRALRVRRRAHRRGPRLLLQQGLRRRHRGSRRATELSYMIFPSSSRDDLELPEHVRGRRPGVHRRHLPERAARRRPARRDAEPAGPGRLEDALHQPVEPQALADRRRRRRQDGSSASSSPTTTRDGPRDVRRLDRRHRDHRRARPGSAARARRTGSLTTRGTNSSGGFSRGNNIPATAVPHGFNFWTPVTNAGSLSWLYEYQRANNADNLPTLAGVRGQPRAEPVDGRPADVPGHAVGGGSRTADRPAARALAFRHDNEIARPHYYGVTFENGLKTEIAPTDHAAMFRFTFPGDDASLIFDNVNERRRRSRIDQRGRRRHRLLGRPQRPVHRRHAHVRLRDVRQAGHGQRARAGEPDGLRALRRARR